MASDLIEVESLSHSRGTAQRHRPPGQRRMAAAQQKVLTQMVKAREQSELNSHAVSEAVGSVQLLDKVQKRQPIGADQARALRARKLIEGRAPNHLVSAQVADVLGAQAQYLLDKGFTKDFYLMWVLKRLRMGDCKRAELERLLLGKLSELLSADQKRNKVKNLLAEMSRKALITADGKRGSGAVWRVLPAGLDKLASEGGG